MEINLKRTSFCFFKLLSGLIQTNIAYTVITLKWVKAEKKAERKASKFYHVVSLFSNKKVQCSQSLTVEAGL